MNMLTAASFISILILSGLVALLLLGRLPRPKPKIITIT